MAGSIKINRPQHLRAIRARVNCTYCMYYMCIYKFVLVFVFFCTVPRLNAPNAHIKSPAINWYLSSDLMARYETVPRGWLIRLTRPPTPFQAHPLGIPHRYPLWVPCYLPPPSVSVLVHCPLPIWLMARTRNEPPPSPSSPPSFRHTPALPSRFIFLGFRSL